VGSSGLNVLMAMLEQERETLCGIAQRERRVVNIPIACATQNMVLIRRPRLTTRVTAMGVHVILHINPQSINADDWARVHDDTLALLEAWPIPLLGWGVRSVEGVQVPMYMRSLRCDERDPRNAHWSVIGDKGSLQTGECQTLYRDLRHYKRQLNRPFNEDIVTAAAAPEKDDTSGSARVFGDKTQGYPFHFAVLAAAMLVEERFPRAAMVWGNIDRGQAEEARRMAAPILGREMPLPIRVDAPRLIERLRADFKGDALAQAFNRVFLTDVDNRYEAMLHAFPGEEGAREWLRELAHYSSPSSLGVLGLLIAWLNAGRLLWARRAGSRALIRTARDFRRRSSSMPLQQRGSASRDRFARRWRYSGSRTELPIQSRRSLVHFCLTARRSGGACTSTQSRRRFEMSLWLPLATPEALWQSAFVTKATRGSATFEWAWRS
jgi:hypothetical protein